jgi:two-component system chemotaxis response regulator CheY
MLTKYIDIVTKCSKDVLKMMADINIANVQAKQEETSLRTYSIAHSIKYEDLDNKVNGNFILGFADESEAIHIASAIAKNIGLEPIGKFDETAADVLNEFLNTVAGHIITEWDKLGWNVRFAPPAAFQNKDVTISNSSNTDTYMIVFEFASDSKTPDLKDNAFSLMVTFTKNIEGKPSGKRILVVEDSAMMRKYITRALENSGYETEQAEDGMEAVAKYKTFNPDLTIMDLIMPKMGGLDAIVEIQESDPKAKFIVFTSTSRRDEVVTAKSLNVISYLVKPLKIEDLMVKVKEALEQIGDH